MTNTLFYLHRKRDNLIHVNFYVDFKRRFCRFFVFSQYVSPYLSTQILCPQM